MGIFANESKLWTKYQARIRMRNKLIGGTPKDPAIQAKWIRTKAKLTNTEEEMAEMIKKTAIEMGVHEKDAADILTADAFEVSEAVSERTGTGFKSDEKGLYLDGRCIHACLKENASIVLSQVYNRKYGASDRLGAKNYVAEHVQIPEERVYLGKTEVDGIETFIGHTQNAKGQPQSNIGLHDYVVSAVLEFEVWISGDDLTQADWADLWESAQLNGLGSLRSQDYGRFDIELWQKIEQGVTTKKASVEAAAKKEEQAAEKLAAKASKNSEKKQPIPSEVVA